MPDRKPPPEVVELSAPDGLHAGALSAGGEEFLVISYPLPRWRLPDVLTPAEHDVIVSLLDGASRDEIAVRRASSVSTVSNLIAQAFAKLGVGSRLELATKLAAPRARD